MPGSPTALAASPGDEQVTLSWTAPAWLGGSAITGYRVESSLDGKGWDEVVADTEDAATSYVVTGLTNGTAVHFRVSAINTTGTGDPSDSVSATPTAAPAAPGGGGGGGGPADPPVTDPVETPSTDAPATPDTPAVPVGQARVTVDGVEQPVQVSTTPDGTTTLRGDGFSIALVGVGPRGASLASDAAGRLVVVSSGAVVVSGSGFSPGSTVEVWLYSTPTLLGQVTVGLDGRFSHALPLPAGVAVGTHTVRLMGTSTTGGSLSASTGLVVLAPVAAAPTGAPAGSGAGSGPGSELAATGSDAPTMVALGLAFIAAGALLLRPRRRTA